MAVRASNNEARIKVVIRIRKNFYHDIQILEWETHFNNTIADFLGIILKNCQ